MRRKDPPKETSRPKQQIKMRRASAHLMSEAGGGVLSRIQR